MASLNHASQNTGNLFFKETSFFKDGLYAQAKVGTFKVNDTCVTTHYLHLSSHVSYHSWNSH